MRSDLIFGKGDRMFRWHYDPPGTSETVDTTGWLSAPPGTWGGRILGGILVPLVCLIIAARFIIMQHGFIIGRGGFQPVDGAAAIALGIATAGIGVFLHAHAFWGPVWRLAIIHEVGRVIGALMFIGGFGYVLWSMLWLGP